MENPLSLRMLLLVGFVSPVNDPYPFSHSTNYTHLTIINNDKNNNNKYIKLRGRQVDGSHG